MKYISLKITTLEELMASKILMTPLYLTNLIQTGCIGRKVTRKLAKQLGTMTIFEACAHNEITSEQAADIMILQRESDYWIVRKWKQIIG